MWDVQDLFKRHNRDLTRFLRSRVTSPETAADLAQELFLRLLTAAPTAIADDRAYLFRAAGNLAISHNRRERLLSVVDDPAVIEKIADETPDAERWLLSRQELAIVAATLTEFPPLHRDIFMLSRVDGLSFEEIGKRKGIPRQRAFDHLARVIARLQLRLSDYFSS